MNIVCSVYAEDLVGLSNSIKRGSLRNVIRPPYFIPGDRAIDAQLRNFKVRKLHQAAVLDATGEVVGLVTLEDILEELEGSIQDEHDVSQLPSDSTDAPEPGGLGACPLAENQPADISRNALSACLPASLAPSSAANPRYFRKSMNLPTPSITMSGTFESWRRKL